MYHEHRHCIQKNQTFTKAGLSKLEQAQLIQEIACLENEEYYLHNGNYKINANEIQAEKYGVFSAYEQLCIMFPDVNPHQLESIVLNVVNNKMQNSTYFLKQSEPFTSLDEVDKAFDEAYKNSFNTMRIYYVGRTSKDAAKTFMKHDPKAKDAYLSATDPLEQDRCIAAINLKLHPEWLNFYPALKEMDLSYEKVIEKSHRTGQRAEQKYVSRMREIDAEFAGISKESIPDDYEKY